MGSSDQNFDGSCDIIFQFNMKVNPLMQTSVLSTSDVILPLMIVIGLFLINAIVFILIVRYRKRQRQQSLDRELADL